MSVPTPRSGAIWSFTDGSNILFGGLDASGPQNDTWTFNTSSPAFTQLSPSTTPPARYLHSIGHTEFVSLHTPLIMFGGYNGTSFLNDTYTWSDGSTNWVLQTPTHIPTARHSAAMGGQLGTGSGCTLFGGLSASGVLGDTWNWNGTDWVQYTSLSFSPPARYGAMSIDIIGGGMLMFGGFNGTNYLNDTYGFNDTTHTWGTAAINPPYPPPRAYGILINNTSTAFGGNNSDPILFGGIGPGGILYNDMWGYSTLSGSWTQITNPPPHRPAPRQMAAGLSVQYVGGSSPTYYLFGGLS